MPSSPSPSPAVAVSWRENLHEIIFEADTRPGKAFDVILLVAILLSIVVVSLETVEQFDRYDSVFKVTEWVLTILFTIEYLLRLVCVSRPSRYATSFFGIIDLFSILPTYLTLFDVGTRSLVVIRAFRLLRAFRVFKLARMLSEAATMRQAMWDARGKIVVFLATVLIVVTVAGVAMYVIENTFVSPSEPSQFTSIPQAMYWAIVTMTTVGDGDIVPKTHLGKLLSALLIMIGYSLIIVPTGFVSAELVSSKLSRPVSTQACPHCMAEGHEQDAVHCRYCGGKL